MPSATKSISYNFGIPQYSYLSNNRVQRIIQFKDKKFVDARKIEHKTANATADYHRALVDVQERDLNKSSKNEKKLTYIDLFCGGGGLSLGVHQTCSLLNIKPRCLVAVDSDKAALSLLSHHFKPLVALGSSVEDLIRYHIELVGQDPKFLIAPEILESRVKQFKGKTTLLVGGPPCQGHSNLNNRTRSYDERNLLYYMMPAFAVALDIPHILIENVRNITSATENVVAHTAELLRKHGYNTKEVILEASNFGVAQTRVRHFLVASKKSDLAYINDLGNYKGEVVTFDNINSNCDTPDNYPSIMTSTNSMSAENVRRISYLHNNNIYDLPNSERPNCHREGHTYPSVYGRIKPDEPMGTLTTGFSSPGRGRFIHPHEPRTINIREAARIQSFPDWYWNPVQELSLSKANLCKIIGDAVPPQLVIPLLANLLISELD